VITLTYDRRLDMTYMGYVREPGIVKTLEYSSRINIDLNKDHIVVGLEYDGTPKQFLEDPRLRAILDEYPSAQEILRPFW
jgi:uncharacterized protein YuzE